MAVGEARVVTPFVVKEFLKNYSHHVVKKFQSEKAGLANYDQNTQPPRQMSFKEL